MNSDQILKDTKDRMEKALNVFIEELKGLRTGRATPALVDNIKVDYYGSPTPLKQVAQISTPDPQQIMIKPFDFCSHTRQSVGDDLAFARSGERGYEKRG